MLLRLLPHCKGTFLHNAVSSHWDCSKRFTLHPLLDLFIPTPTRLLWEDSATLQLRHEDYSFTCPSMSAARYSCVQLSELWQRGMNEIAKASKRQQEDSNPGSLDESPTVYRALLHDGRVEALMSDRRASFSRCN